MSKILRMNGFALGEDGILSKRFVEFVNAFLLPDFFNKETGKTALRTRPIPFLPHAQAYLNLLNLRVTVTPIKLSRLFVMARKTSFAKPFYAKEVQLYYRSDALPRAFIVHRAIFEPEKEAVFTIMRNIKEHFANIIVVQSEKIQHIVDALKKVKSPQKSQANIIRYTPNDVLIEADMKDAGFLVLSDTYHPDWQVTVNGKKSEIYITDHLIRSVFLTQGKHQVHFRFRPFSFYLGIAISSLTLLLMLLSLIFSTFLNRKK